MSAAAAYLPTLRGSLAALADPSVLALATDCLLAELLQGLQPLFVFSRASQQWAVPGIASLLGVLQQSCQVGSLRCTARLYKHVVVASPAWRHKVFKGCGTRAPFTEGSPPTSCPFCMEPAGAPVPHHPALRRRTCRRCCTLLCPSGWAWLAGSGWRRPPGCGGGLCARALPPAQRRGGCWVRASLLGLVLQPESSGWNATAPPPPHSPGPLHAPHEPEPSPDGAGACPADVAAGGGALPAPLSHRARQPGGRARAAPEPRQGGDAAVPLCRRGEKAGKLDESQMYPLQAGGLAWQVGTPCKLGCALLSVPPVPRWRRWRSWAAWTPCLPRWQSGWLWALPASWRRGSAWLWDSSASWRASCRACRLPQASAAGVRVGGAFIPAGTGGLVLHRIGRVLLLTEPLALPLLQQPPPSSPPPCWPPPQLGTCWWCAQSRWPRSRQPRPLPRATRLRGQGAALWGWPLAACGPPAGSSWP